MKRVRVAYTDRTLVKIGSPALKLLLALNPDSIVETLPGVYWQITETQDDRDRNRAWLLLREVNGHDIDPRNRPVELPLPDEWLPLLDAPEPAPWGLPMPQPLLAGPVEKSIACVHCGTLYTGPACPRC